MSGRCLVIGRSPNELAAAPLALAAGNNPVAADAAVGAGPSRASPQLGLPADGFIALRVGRPDPRKWSDLLIVHGVRLLAALPRLHFVFLSAPSSREGVIRHLMGKRATLAPFTTDRADVQRYMAAADVMLHYARYGESFGYAIAEAALAGLPVIAQATPWGDNAQVELVRDGETGFIVADFAGALDGLRRLMADKGLGRAMAMKAAADILARFGVGATWRLLEAFVEHAGNGGRGLLTKPEELARDQRAEARCRDRELWRSSPGSGACRSGTAALCAPLVLAPDGSGRCRDSETAPRPMKILMFLHDAYGGHGGIARNNLDVIDGLVADKRVERVVAVPRRPGRDGAAIPAKVDWRREAGGGIGAYLASSLKAIFAGRAELVLCAHIRLLPVAWLASLATGAPLWLTIFGIDAWKKPRNPLRTFLARRADRVIAISEVTAGRFQSWAHMAETRLRLLPCIVDLDRFRPGPPIRPIRRSPRAMALPASGCSSPSAGW